MLSQSTIRIQQSTPSTTSPLQSAMFQRDDTIVAVATPPGRGGIGVVRISGPEAASIALAMTGRRDPFTPRHATLTHVKSSTASPASIDRVVVTFFPAPHSYTGEDVAEISAHGSPVLLRAIVSEGMRQGARLAEPGEFTLRAYLNERIDLVQAEAVRDLVNAVTPLQARAAFDQLEGTLTASIREIDRRLLELTARLEASLDFPDEGYHFVEGHAAAGEIATVASQIGVLLQSGERGRLIREGLHVVLAGRPNTGKSSLFNALAGAGRAIVTDVPGTTRDLLTEVVDVDGVPVTIVDTAGARLAPGDAIEAEGIARAQAAREIASVVVLLLDGSQPLTSDDHALLEDTSRLPRVVAINKSDLPEAWTPEDLQASTLKVSVLTGAGLAELRSAVLQASVSAENLRDAPGVTNIRHIELLTRAREALQRAEAAATAGSPEEFVLADLTEARTLLEEVTGTRTPDDLLAHIFASFCIGK
jgi:tRNA modification GTPase